LLKNSILFLLLGGAAVHRCDNWLFSATALAAEGDCGARHEFFSTLFSPEELPMARLTPTVKML